MEYLNNLTFFLASIISLALTPQPVNAQQLPNCFNIYNGGNSCTNSELFDIEKTVQNPQDGTFVQNLEPNQTRIRPGNTMIFRITVTNTTDKTLENLQVTDQFSDTLIFGSAQRGTYDETAKQLSYTIESLPEGESETFDLQAMIRPANELPNVTGPLCAINVTTVAQEDESESANVQFCIEKTDVVSGTNQQSSFPTEATSSGTSNTVTPDTNTTTGGQTIHKAPTSKTSPNTGPELLALIGLLPAGLGGYFLRRKTSSY